MEGFLNAKSVIRALQKSTSPVTRAKIISTLEGFTNEDLSGFAVLHGKQSHLGSRFVNLTMIHAAGSLAR